jgi:hypothetical protein
LEKKQERFLLTSQKQADRGKKRGSQLSCMGQRQAGGGLKDAMRSDRSFGRPNPVAKNPKRAKAVNCNHEHQL